MRTFMALPVNLACQQQLTEQLEALRAREDLAELWQDIRWISPENYHLTLQFLGQTSEAQLAEIKARLPTWFADGMSYFEAEIQSLNAFPHPETGPYLVASLDATLMMQALRRECIDQLKGLGFAKPEKAFRPHITLGKWQKPVPEGFSAMALSPVFLTVHSVCLYQSLPQATAPVYQPLACLALATY